MSREGEIVEAVTRAGGFCRRPVLRFVASDHNIATAVRSGAILRVRRGRYALPTARDQLARAHQMTATLSHLSAALHWGWKVKTLPARAQVTVGRHRTVTDVDRREAMVHWMDLPPTDIVGGVTDPVRTVLDCAKELPFDEALCVADSALRSRRVAKSGLVREAGLLRGRGSAAARRVADAADGRAANPFESVLRAIVLEVRAFCFTPQLQIADSGLFVVVDLGDERHRLVLEADSYEFHGGREAHDRDCARYDELVVHGWTVLRFTWEQVMTQPGYVRWCLLGLAASRRGQPVPAPPRARGRAA